MKIPNLKVILEQFIFTLRTHRKAIEFARKHKVWKGFWNYGWVSKALMFIGAIVGLNFLDVYIDWFFSSRSESVYGAVQSMGSLFNNFALEGYELLFAGSMKYVIIVLVEVIIFHASRETIKIILEKKGDTSFNTFLKAQIRMINVVCFAWIMEMICSILIDIALGIFSPLGFLKPALILIVQCYFLGFVVLDNYFEQFDLKIKESLRYTKKYAGVALGIGSVLNLAMLVPFIGAIVGPFIAAITVTLVLYKLSDIHILGRDTIDGVQEMV